MSRRISIDHGHRVGGQCEYRQVHPIRIHASKSKNRNGPYPQPWPIAAPLTRPPTSKIQARTAKVQPGSPSWVYSGRKGSFGEFERSGKGKVRSSAKNEGWRNG